MGRLKDRGNGAVAVEILWFMASGQEYKAIWISEECLIERRHLHEVLHALKDKGKLITIGRGTATRWIKP